MDKTGSTSGSAALNTPLSAEGISPNSELVPNSPKLKVRAGQITFDQEGQEGERFFSRVAHWPGGNSGVTIGRGYDMGHRSSTQIKKQLQAAGMDRLDAESFSKAAFLRGSTAERFVKTNKEHLPTISLDVQKKLFEGVVYPTYVKDAERLATKPDVTEKFGATDWENLNPKIKDIIVDLHYRGDYSAGTRNFLQKTVVENDLKKFSAKIADTDFWKDAGVPIERLKARVKYLKTDF